MNFFEQQRKTQSKTKTLVFLFALAIVALIFVGYFSIQWTVFGYIYPYKLQRTITRDSSIIWSYSLLWKVALGTIITIVFGSFQKIRELSDGGCTIAHMMNGRLVDPETKDLKEKQLLNVVEEMAIAAGIPAPNVYLLDREFTINAFAAGYTLGDAVIGVTRGTIEKLTREELQGVVAHEFSHILHGDMRLNIRLLGLLHGILMISTIGRFMLSGNRYQTNKRGNGGIFLFGIIMIIFGWVGYFFGKLIQAAISRQREFLADASAVQYTRNPDGIGNALKKISGYIGESTVGSNLQNHNRDEISHMTFGAVGSEEWIGWIATHPAIEERIVAIDPHFRPQDYKKKSPLVSSIKNLIQNNINVQEPTRKIKIGDVEMPVSPKLHYLAGNITPLVGTIPEASVTAQRSWLENLEPSLYQATHHSQKSKAVMYVLMAEYNLEAKSSFKKILELRDPHITDLFDSLWNPIKELGVEARLRLVDLSLPALKKLSKEEYEEFKVTIIQLIESDKKISLFEYLLMKTIKKHLNNYFYPTKSKTISIANINEVEKEMTILLSSIALAGTEDLILAGEAFDSGTSGLFSQSSMLKPEQINIQDIRLSLRKLQTTTFEIRKQFIDGCSRIALFDKKATWKEKELLRIIGDSLDCPIPFLTQ